MKRYRVVSFQVSVVRDPGDKNPHYIRTAETAARLARDFIPDDDREHFGVFCLNNKNRLMGYHEASVGSLTSATVSPREVFKVAILAGAAALVLVHNHPSGDPAPSRDDIEITARLRECAELFGIKILDHVIIGNGTAAHYSFAEKALL